MITFSFSNQIRRSSLCKKVVGFVVTALFAGQSVFGATFTWDITPGAVGVGDGSITDGSGIWNLSTGNWTTDAGVNNVLWGNAGTDNAIFGGGTLGTFGTVTLGAAINANSLTFNTPNGGGAYTLNTSTFGLTLQSGITANESATIQSGVGGTVLLGTNNIWSVANTKTLTVSSVVDDGVGTFSINKQGTGTLTLSGANTFGGGVTLTAGALNIGSAAALGTGTLTISTGTIDNSSGGALTLTTNNAQAWNGDFTFAGTNNLNLGTGTATLSANRQVTVSAGSLILGGAMAGDFTLTKAGGGALVLQAAATRAGTAVINTTINGGKIRLENATGMSSGTTHLTIINTSGTLELASNITHNQPITLNDGGTVRADGTATEQGVITVQNTGTPSVTFATTNASDILTLGNGDNDLTGGIAAATLNVSGPGVVLVAGDGTPTNNVLGTWTVGTGATLRLQRGTDALLGNTANDITLNGGSFSLLATSDLTANAGRVFTMGTGGGTIEVGTGRLITMGTANQLTGSTTFAKTGGGTVSLTAANNFSGTATVNGGTLSLSGAGTLASATAWTIRNRGILTLDNSGTNSGDRIAGTLASNGGTVNFTANAAATTETLGALTLNAGALTINSTAGAGGSTLTINSIPTRAVGGTLYVNNNAGANVVLGTAPALVNSILNYAVVNDGSLISFANYPASGGASQTVVPLALASHNQGAETTWAAGNNVRPTADATVSTTPRTFYTLTLDSGIDLLGPAGDRTLNISGGVLQTGGTSLVAANGNSEYILAFGANEAVFQIVNGGTLQLNRGNTNTLTGTAGLTKSGDGTLILNGASTLTVATGGSAIHINQGILELRGATSLLPAASTAPVNLNGATLRLSNDAATVYNAPLVVNADSAIEISRPTTNTTALTHTVGTLSIGSSRILSVSANAAQFTSNAAYGLTTTVLTLTGPGIINVANNGTGTGTMTVAAPTGAFQLTKTGTGDLVTNSITTGYSGPVDVQAGRVGWSGASGTIAEGQLFAGAGGIIKSGAGTVNLSGANTFTGAVQINDGTLQFSTVGNNGAGTASNLGQGTNGIGMAGGVLSFIGSTNQSTNRTIVGTAAYTLDASGTGGAVFTQSGAISTTSTTGITLGGTGFGVLNAVATVSGTGGDLLKQGAGTWRVDVAQGGAADDDWIVRNGTLILNVAAALDPDDFFVTGATIRLGVNGAITSLVDDLNVSTETATGGILDIAGTTGSAPTDLVVGSSNNVFTGSVIDSVGGGSIGATGTITLRQGTVSANLASAAAIIKNAPGTTLTLSGNNAGLTGTTAVSVAAGTLILDYTTSNTTKLRTATGLAMAGGDLMAAARLA